MEDLNSAQGDMAAKDGSAPLSFISLIVGIVFFAIGVVNTCWGNDPGFGMFITLLSLVYFFR
jgi:uncharacterized membrane protein YiaA